MRQVVDVYLLDAAQLEPVVPQCLSLLTPSRRAAAEQYQDQPAKLRVIAAGLLLHKVLGIQSDADLVFNEYGKPFLAAGGPQFSLSHAGRCAALAAAPFPVGVDIEPMKEAYPQVLRSYFRPEELEWLDQSPGAERFYTLWTRLESALKAMGTGLISKKRAFSLLDDSPLFFSSTIYSGHMLACAAAEHFTIRQTDMSIHSLLA